MELSDVIFRGLGSMYGGKYRNVRIEGMAKLKSALKCDSMRVDGTLKSKAYLEVGRFECNGVARMFRDVKAGEVVINGVLKLRRAKLEAESVRCDGVISCTDEINADAIDINFQEYFSVQALYGDTIAIAKSRKKSNTTWNQGQILNFITIYTGRRFESGFARVDMVECTSLTAECLVSDVVRVGSATLTNHCRIGRLEYSGVLNADETCRIGKIVKVEPRI